MEYPLRKPRFKCRVFVLSVTTLMSGCGGVMDYYSRPVAIHGELVGITSTEEHGAIIVGSPTPGHGSRECAKAFLAGNVGVCLGRKVTPGPDGTFQTEVPGSMRGCAYLLIPPLLDAFCDRKSYLVVAVPTNPLEVYQITIWPKGSTSIIGPYPKSKKIAGDHLQVLDARQIKGLDSIDLRVDVR